MAQAHAPAADKYYVPHSSPWPIYGSVSLFTLMLGAVCTLNNWLPAWSLIPGFLMLVSMFVFWFGTVIGENEHGMYNMAVDRSFRMGMMWFIFSEVMFFAAFFGALFYARELAVPWLSGHGVKIFNSLLLWKDYSGTWPTNGPATLGPRANGTFETVSALGLPAINTAILLSSSVTVTIAHHALIAGHRTRLKIFLALTFLLGFTFVFLQAAPQHRHLRLHVFHVDRFSRLPCNARRHHADGDLVPRDERSIHAATAFWVRGGCLVLALRRRGMAGTVHLRLLALDGRLLARGAAADRQLGWGTPSRGRPAIG
jgi:cytochrome c oxidase subunit III